jgi:hypothetical protein
MLRVNQLNGFGETPYGAMTTLRQAEFLLLPISSRVAIDGTGGFPDVGGDVGTIVNRGTLGGSLFATANGNRATLQGLSRLAVRGSRSVNVQMQQTFTAATPSTIYTITAFIPRSVDIYERILSVAQNALTADFANSDGAALLFREVTANNWGVYRDSAQRGAISATIDVLTVFETICESTQTTICKDGGTDTVTSHGAIGSFNVSSFRFLNAHDSSGTYASATNADVLVSAIFFTNPSANFRSRALAEVRTIAGIATP